MNTRSLRLVSRGFVLGLILAAALGGFVLVGQAAPVSALPDQALDPGARVTQNERCFASLDGSTVFSSTDAQALRDAVALAADGAVVRVAGTCAGVASGAGHNQVVYIDRPLSLRGGYTLTNWVEPDPLANPTTLDAQGGGRVVYFESGAITLENMTLTGGDFGGNGGGIYNAQATLTLSRTSVISNTANNGGGVYVHQGHVTLVDGQILSNTATFGGGVCIWQSVASFNQTGVSTITLNTASDSGGGVYVELGTATLSQGQVVANSANEGGGLYIHNGGQVILNGVQVLSNTANLGGGVSIHWGGQVVFSRGQIRANKASSGGGGYIFGGAAVFSQTGDSLITFNTATSGGGLYVTSGRALLDAGQILANDANEGGGLYVNRGYAVLSGGQIRANTANKGGGVYVLDTSAVFTQTGVSTITLNTAASNGGGVYVGSGRVVLAQGWVLSNTAGNGGGVYVDQGVVSVNGGQVVSNRASGATPNGLGGGLYVSAGRANLTMNGGQVANNQAVNNGGGFYVSAARASLEAGQVLSNAAQLGGGVFIYEGDVSLSGAEVVSNTAHHGGGVYVDWREAVFTQTLSGTLAYNTANLGAGVYVDQGRALLEGGQVATNTAQSGGGLYVFHTDARAEMRGGQVKGNMASNNGGGLYLAAGRLQLSGGQVLSNTAAANGGGVYVASGTGVFTHTGVSTITLNTADLGGGVYVGSNHATWSGGAILSNTARAGGGVYMDDGDLELRDVILSYNRGAALAFNGGAAELFTATLEGNDVGVRAGGEADGSLLLHNSLISGSLSAGLVYTGPGVVAVTLGDTPELANRFSNNALNIDVAVPHSTHPPIYAFWSDWGTRDLAAIEAGLHHQFDDAQLARVIYYSLTLTASPVQQWADGRSSITLTGGLDGLLGPGSGNVVSFTTDLGHLSALTATTDINYHAGVTLTSEQIGTAHLTATIRMDQLGVQPAHASALFVASDLQMNKALTPQVAVPGQRVTYTLAFSNVGNVAAMDVVITDLVPISLTALSSQVALGGTPIQPTPGLTYSWVISRMAPGQAGSITIAGQVRQPQPAGVFTNTAILTSSVLDAPSTNNRSDVALTVLNVPPLASDGQLHTDEYSPIAAALQASDANGDALRYAVHSASAYGTLVISDTSRGTFVYTPTNRITTYTDRFTFVVTDTGGLTGTAILSVTVSAGNDSPQAADATSATNEDTHASGSLDASDPDTDDSLSYSLAAAPLYGSVSVNAQSGVWEYVPANRLAPYTVVFSLTVSDSGGLTDTARITVMVSADNDAPQAADDEASTVEETPVSAVLAVADPDTDDSLSYALLTAAAYGKVSIHDLTGGWVYTPANRLLAYTDIFTLSVTDMGGLTDTARITLTVSADNDAPQAADDAGQTNEDTPLTLNVLSNDRDPEGAALSISALGAPDYGTASLQGATLVYTPANRTANYTAVFTYTASDGSRSSTAHVTVSVAANNDAPQAGDDTADTSEDAPVTIQVLANDSDPEGSILSVSALGRPDVGQVGLSGKTVVYTPTNRAAHYTAVFTYTASDGGLQATARVTVHVTADNDAPQAVNNVYEAGGEPLSVAAPGVLDNDRDPEGQALTAVLGAPPAVGDLSLKSNGSFVYTPTLGYSGQVTFTYRAYDGSAHSNLATVGINVSGTPFRVYLPLAVKEKNTL